MNIAADADGHLLSRLLGALDAAQSLELVVPYVLAQLERDPLACGGRFRGDLLRGLMEVGGAYWSHHETEYECYRAILRRAALDRRGNMDRSPDAFWTEL